MAEQTVSKVALQIGSAQKAALTRDGNGYPVLELYLDYERAWATVGQALDNAEVEVTSLDRDRGTFLVTMDDSVFTGEETGGGFLCRFTFSCDRSEAYDFRIQMQAREDDVFAVSVLQAADDQPAEAGIAQQVLVLLREYAS